MEIIVSCTVIRGSYGPDHVIMEVNLPCGTWPYVGYQSVKMDLAAGTAEEYFKKNLPDVKYKIIKV